LHKEQRFRGSKPGNNATLGFLARRVEDLEDFTKNPKTRFVGPVVTEIQDFENCF
ncbi:hypothetical protein K1T71_013428, partial [Dendrolimus kikuchii]